MATVVICIFLLFICIYSVKNYLKRIAHGCCGGGGDSEKKIKVKDKNKSHYPYKKQVQIRGMSCSHCKLRIENSFHEQEGMYAKADWKNNRAVIFMKEDIPDEKIKEIIRRAGYQPGEITY